jgi:putative transposase
MLKELAEFDTTVDGRLLKLLNIVDEFTRESPAIVGTALSTPTRWWPPSTASWPSGVLRHSSALTTPRVHRHAVADWCRFNGVGSVFIDPGSPLAERLDRVVQRPAA